jgi:hypothetical protein
VLDDDHGVATVPQPQQCLGEPSVGALVRPDARFVQHVQHADRTGADPGGRPDPLRLAAGQTGGGPVQWEMVQADVDKEPQSPADLRDDGVGDSPLPAGRRHRPGRAPRRQVMWICSRNPCSTTFFAVAGS